MERVTGNETPSPIDLLVELAALYRVQPATALWRAVEIAEVLRYGLPRGIGLDLGCGDGALAGLVLCHLGHRPTMIGLDSDPREIAVADRRGLYERTITAGGEAMLLEDCSVDFVFSNSVLEHIPCLDSTIAEVARVLRPHGRMIATVPAPAFKAMLAGPLLRGRGDRVEYLARMDARLGHLNYLDTAGWRDLLARHGLRLETARAYLNARQLRRWERFSGLTGGALQLFGANAPQLYRLQRLVRADDAGAAGLLEVNNRPARWQWLWARLVAGDVLDGNDASGTPEGACLLIDSVRVS